MKWITMLFILLGCGTLYSQTYTVRGKVLDFHNKAPLNHAKIEWGGTVFYTDSKGIFSLDIEKGNYILKVSHPNCEEFSESITVDRNIDVEITLEHHVNEIESVTLQGRHRNNGSMVLKTLDQNQIFRKSTENLGNLLSDISGVGALKTGNNISKPIIHGLYGSRVSILNNNVKLAEQEWGVEHAPNVEVSNFEHIDVIKGASALKYGSGAVGGVILLEPEILPKKDSVMGKISLSGISNGRGAGFDIQLAKTWENGWAVKTGGSFEKLGDLKAPDYGLMNTGIQNSGFMFGVQKNTFNKGFSVEYYLTNKNIGILRSSHISSAEDLAEALSSGQPLYTRKFSYDIDNPRLKIPFESV